MQQRHNQGGGKQPPAGGSGTGSDGIERLLRQPSEKCRYFADNTGAPRKELLDEEAQRVAEKLKTLPASQLRRFYAEVMALKRRLELDDTLADGEITAQLALLKAKAAYTCKRNEKYPDELVRFFTRHAAAVGGRRDFLRGFQPHFEAVMAYHRVFEQKKGDRD